MVVVNPKNWHWVERDTVGWTKQYFETQFIPLVYDNDTYVIEIFNVNEIAGDSNVSQRKGKVICYFDLKLKFSAKATAKANNEEIIQFELDVPEFMHDEEEFLTEFLNLDRNHACYKVIVNEFKPIFVKQMLKYQSDLIDSHSKDVQE